jgi:hypothetical protein
LINTANRLVEHAYWDIFFEWEHAKAYIDAYKIFEIITYFAMTMKDEVALSGVYSRYDPTVINLHRALYRLSKEAVIFPDFYSGHERLMYWFRHDTETYEEIWADLHSNDPFLEGGDISSILFHINSKGIASNKRKIIIICKDKSSDRIPMMLSNLLNNHTQIKAELQNINEFIDLMKYVDDITHGFAERQHLLKLIMFVSLDHKTLNIINNQMREFNNLWDELKTGTNWLVLLPFKEKLEYNSKTLVLKPKKTIWYDPDEPFKMDSDVFEIIQNEFGQFVLGKGSWESVF